ncbi:hypothetical protein HMPREF1531_02195 [Propionibacterium sp. oral taxon 192 str. F0372]|uniref:DUF3710 domain-containing protein n=1 Tax=Propionibacterium sp. oral taxon 192 TaxID=671222 RepID=UPI000353443B|nr:DUF3710 domain-containing protein [Propionibacterium sp. oral taxon 192]EPH02879.1 hypothetical protein HMPREF1531_02195 [Propionibacterium sp. oral taxon 192 str. F0372]
MFGRRKRAKESVVEPDPETLDELDEDEVEAGEAELDEPTDKWAALDVSRDWRSEGPFDIEEVDLDADEIERLDFGCVVLTPFDGMQLQLQVDQKTQQVQAALVMYENSAIEIALFAAPAHTSMVGDVRDEMVTTTQSHGGRVALAEGPFGTEVRRAVPLKDSKGNDAVHVSRTWFAQGPRWLLRGVVMGEAGQVSGIDGPTEMLYEFFANTVVRRDSSPKVPGDLIPMTLPTALEAAATTAKG